jgi:hypothetical protein
LLRRKRAESPGASRDWKVISKDRENQQQQGWEHSGHGAEPIWCDDAVNLELADNISALHRLTTPCVVGRSLVGDRTPDATRGGIPDARSGLDIPIDGLPLLQ